MRRGALIRGEEGSVLLVTLAALAVLTALIVEFAYGVYVSTAAVNNWKGLQRLSLAASSGVAIAAARLGEGEAAFTGALDAGPRAEEIGAGFEGELYVAVYDENARFNVNSIVRRSGLVNDRALSSFKRLLKGLGIDESVADAAADWIDPDEEPEGQASPGVGGRAKNRHLDSPDELLLVRGVTPEVYRRLAPYVTAYGMGGVDSEAVNINTAPPPVLMALDEGITREMADRVISYRTRSPFAAPSDIVKVAGFETIGARLLGRIAVKSSNYRVTSRAVDAGLERSVAVVIESSGGVVTVRYWMES